MDYVILEGVRRSLAYRHAGRREIPAIVLNDGREVARLEVPIGSLWSRKDHIDASDPRKRYRYEKLCLALQDGDDLDAITIEPGRTGTPLKAVEVVYSPDELPP